MTSLLGDRPVDDPVRPGGEQVLLPATRVGLRSSESSRSGLLSSIRYSTKWPRVALRSVNGAAVLRALVLQRAAAASTEATRTTGRKGRDARAAATGASRCAGTGLGLSRRRACRRVQAPGLRRRTMAPARPSPSTTMM